MIDWKALGSEYAPGYTSKLIDSFHSELFISEQSLFDVCVVLNSSEKNRRIECKFLDVSFGEFFFSRLPLILDRSMTTEQQHC